MRPVSAAFEINQPFGSMRTAGVVGDITRLNTVEYYVARYGNYQPYGHAGADFKCPEGTPVRAIAAGTVLWADWGTNLPGDESNAGYRKRWYLYKGFPGIVTVIQHPGWIGVYAHLSKAPLNRGDRVTEGQVIALSGATGGVAAHLHVEALVDLNYTTGGGLIYGRTDPENYFNTGLAAAGTITEQPAEEEDDMFNDTDRVQANRQTQILEAFETDTIRAMIKELAVNDYVKGDADDSIYELRDGKLRGISGAEWELLGRPDAAIFEQSKIDAFPKA